MSNLQLAVIIIVNLIVIIGWTFILSYSQPFAIKGRSAVKKSFLKLLVRDRKLTPKERLAARIGYLGAGLLIAAQWTIAPPLYIAGFICVLIQTTVRKQWNLVALQINGLVAWIIHLMS